MLIDGGGQKNVFTWLTAQIMAADLHEGTMTSDAVNMLIDAAFRANDPGINKVGLLSPPFNAILDDFAIAEMPIGDPIPDEPEEAALVTDSVDAAFADMASDDDAASRSAL